MTVLAPTRALPASAIIVFSNINQSGPQQQCPQPVLLPSSCSPAGTGTPNPTVWVTPSSSCPPGHVSI